MAAAVLITLTLVQAPSAFAQLTSAVSRTAGQSYHFSATTTTVTLPGTGTPMTARRDWSGAFDPARRVGEETTSTGEQARFIGGSGYLNGQLELPVGKSWLRAPSPTLSVPVAASSAPPRATVAMPETSGSGGESFSRNPLAPARSASKTYLSF